MTFRVSVERYLGAVAQQYHRGDAREESYYDVLKQLWEELGSQLSSAHATLTVLPRQTEAGNPDMRVWSGQQHVTGYIEAKEPGVINLDHVEVSEQLKRYRAAFPNVILTNFLEFRLYRFGQPMGEPVIIGSLQALQAGMKVPFQHEDQFRELVERFFDFQLPRAYTAQTLAIALADRTRFLQQQVLAQLVDDEDHKRGSELVNLMAEFKQVLMSDLTSDTFADLYAQTITYGLFAARTRTRGIFKREVAFDGIPGSIGILRKLFRYISGGDTPERLSIIIEDIADVLAVADTDAVFKGYGKNGRDPIADFYEKFLARYNPAEREQRGVYYTPQPVVSYIVRSVDQILRGTFGKPDGLADPSVTVLDPAAGTMTFPATAVRLAAATYKAKYGDGSLDSWIKGHILRDFYAFELMMAPYAIGHMRMGLLLHEIGYDLAESERIPLYLTNSLENSEATHGTPIPGLSPLVEEATKASAVKNSTRVLVVMGNPPYSPKAKGGTLFINQKLQDYCRGLGVEYEKKKGVLQDDYVRFMRLAQWKIEQTGKGVVAFITNNSYLDGLIHRSMRKVLLDTFNSIYVLNLHGSVSASSAPHGDENVFDIVQGVAIAIFVKDGSDLHGRIHYSDLTGSRENKYSYLVGNTVGSTKWQDVVPRAPEYWLKAKDYNGSDDYYSWPSVEDVFPLRTSGVETEKDHFVVSFDRDTLLRRLQDLKSSELDNSTLRERYRLHDTANWNLNDARKSLTLQGVDHARLVPYCLHVLDNRFIYFDSSVVIRTREPLMASMLQPNVALLTQRQVKGEGWGHAWVTDQVVGKFALSSKSSNVCYAFPLYIYDEGSAEVGLDQLRRSPNISTGILKSVSEGLGRDVSPEHMFGYVYAVLLSTGYRSAYSHLLQQGFPRIPFTKDRDIFMKLAELGQQLIDLHLMRSPELDNPISRFCGKGDSAVTKIEYDAERGRVSINPTQYFDGVTPDLWIYQIGGYQVLAKWLKDRKGRFLTSADTIHYSRIVTALQGTAVVQAQLSGLFELAL